MILERHPTNQVPVYAASDLTDLQERFFLLQRESVNQKIAHIFLIEGFASTGKGSILQSLTIRLDPRKFKVYSPYVDQSEDRGYPFLWNFWKVVPRYGELLFYLNTYYSRLAYLRSEKKIGLSEYDQRLLSILNTERILSKDKVIVHKFFLHISKKDQKKRLEDSKKKKKEWELSHFDKDQGEHYNRYFEIFDSILSASRTIDSPWQIIYNSKKEETKLLVFEAIIERLERILQFDSRAALHSINHGTELIP
ncbi:polyphosphate kinase [Leptospira noumeaensis]|uniref:Polyphosphate kinase n=2 Tax=Leptospira TaxID=171 RepID=A0A6N4QJE4_9LEPT|nr:MULTISPECIES: polyphosphate kinase [Leptospira]TGK53853.1 polyphosphate kinase [Leptospira kanakyensis]TGK57648.1 polyphosphate kinase [Leptospira kanakyensis]TGK73358.1 polyphosphate kinase [Leptospira kanakyensis]TGK86875.1 polyphosphate kinase [Leptospira noumeaensis]